MAKAQRSGRPRDPGVEQRALSAARAVYAERGWSGFSLDEVARRSGIGKGSLYLRWPDKAALLVAAVRERARFIAEIDTGSLRGDLVEFARGWRDYLRTDEGALIFRLGVDATFSPQLAEAFAEDPYPEHIRATRAIIRRGLARGELPEGTSVALVADLVAGAVTNHVHTTPAHLLDAQSPDRVDELVDVVLAGTQKRSEVPSGTSDL
ncbi:TetR/AcrR family transcriptional regulator [Saccharopolyspora rhizosphaerae]|uniref:TetR/AcrR family transcriptional regulator n=1 Tax=Saccharopolyspora rhizosphaerae TaxID=2492662 RepID=UPI00131581A4|nr:TetR/AcrR family transcriptional regulator [Saccharopolyspora rhizosphaerae]